MNRTSSLLRTAFVAHVSRRTKAYAGHIKGSMNDLPQPCGNWQTHYDANQRKYNMQLMGGVAFLGFTLVVGHMTDTYYYEAARQPDRPAAKNNYK